VPVGGVRSSNERLSGGQLEDKISYIITCRYLSGITPKMRLKYGSSRLNITSVINVDQHNEFLQITAIEGVAT
jgi:SPP1 family predicted phage head-tail adaptor